MEIRKRWIIIGISMVISALPSICAAAVRGKCVNCHTMHNSQEGIAMAFTRDASGNISSTSVPYNRLLKTDCVGCHTHTGSDTTVTIGQTRIPIVYNTVQPTYPPNGTSSSSLAGGNFYWVVNKGQQYGHNIYGIAGSDSRFSSAPGRPSPNTDGCTNCHYTLATVASGCRGCHTPYHHALGTAVVSGRDEGWHRFLGSVMQNLLGEDIPTPDGVIGIKDPDWEQNPAAAAHNVYQGTSTPYVTRSWIYLDYGTISQKCAGCHADFHNNMESGSAWIRHPSDVAIPNSGEFTGYTTYNPLVPVARPNVAAGDQNFSNVSLGSDVVTCISCHRAHGSPYPAMMRWGYQDWPGADSHTGGAAVNGCAVCHTSKD